MHLSALVVLLLSLSGLLPIQSKLNLLVTGTLARRTPALVGILATLAGLRSAAVSSQ